MAVEITQNLTQVTISSAGVQGLKGETGPAGDSVDTSVLTTTSSFNEFTSSIQSDVNSIKAWTASLELINTIDTELLQFYQTTASLNTQTGSQNSVNLGISTATGSLIGITNGLMAFTAALDSTYASDTQLLPILQATRSIELHSGSMVGITNGLMAYTSSNESWKDGIRSEISAIEAWTSSLELINTIDTELLQLYQTTASLNSKTGSYATTGSNTFNGNQTINGYITLQNGAVIKDTSNNGVSFGYLAGDINQGTQSLALGNGAGYQNQSHGTVAIGTNAGAVNQGLRATALGSLAGTYNQGEYAVAIGNYAAPNNQASHSIVISALGVALENEISNSLVIAPIRNVNGNNGVLQYNTTNNEVSYATTLNGITNLATTGSNVFSGSQYIISGGLVFNNGVQLYEDDSDLYIQSLSEIRVRANGNNYKFGNDGNFYTSVGGVVFSGDGLINQIPGGSGDNINIVVGINDGIVLTTDAGDGDYAWDFDKNGDLTVPGNVYGATNLATNGSNIFNGNQIIAGTLLVSGSSDFDGGISITGSLNVSGSITFAPSSASDEITASIAEYRNGISLIAETTDTDGYAQLYWNGLPGTGNTFDGSNLYSWAYASGLGFQIQYKDVANSKNFQWHFDTNGDLSVARNIKGVLNLATTGSNTFSGKQIILSEIEQGLSTEASGTGSHAEGGLTKAKGEYSHAEGWGSEAFGDSSHAEGQLSIASGSYSHAEGAATIAIGPHSHAEGAFTITNAAYQHAQGKFNIPNETPAAFIIGNGINVEERSNLLFAAGNLVEITGSLNVSGSNTFVGNQTISGSLNVSGSTTQIGNNTLTGNTILSGSISISGSTTFNGVHTLSGTNTIIGNTEMSGSINVSGSSNFHNSVFIVTGSSFFTGSHEIRGNSIFSGSINIASGSSYYRAGNKLFNYGQWASLETQSGSANTAYAVKLESTTNGSEGIYIANDGSGFPTRITAENTGLYNVQFSFQLNTTSTETCDFSVWYAMTGSNVANSNTDFSIDKTSGGGNGLAALNFLTHITENDYVQLYWSKTTANGQLVYKAPQGTPTRPATPSVIVTVTQVA
jgi:hypothetical protein